MLYTVYILVNGHRATDDVKYRHELSRHLAWVQEVGARRWYQQYYVYKPVCRTGFYAPPVTSQTKYKYPLFPYLY